MTVIRSPFIALFRTTSFFSASLIALAGASAVHAQTPPGPAPAAAQETAQAPEAGVGDIVVTAQRREQRLQDVPVAITAFSGDQLDRLGIRDSNDLAKVTPGLSFVSGGATPQLSMRGVGTRGVSAGEESTIPIYMDGVYQPNLSVGLIKLASISRVEVLKGPQSALYGRNATGGAINIVTRDPDGFAANGSISYGSYDELVLKGYLAVGDETLAADISGTYQRSDGYFYDIISNRANGEWDQYAVRAKLVWKPSDRIKVTLSGIQAEQSDSSLFLRRQLNTPISVRQQSGPPPIPTKPYDVAFGRDMPVKIAETALALTTAIDLGPVNLTVINGFMDFNQTNVGLIITQGRDGPFFDSNVSSVSQSYYNEAYLQSDGSGPFNWTLGGVYYTDSVKYTKYEFSNYSQPTTVAASFYNTFRHNNSISAESFAVYGEGSYEFNDALTLIAGGRYTDETKDFVIRDFVVGSTGKVPLGAFLTPPVPLNARAKRNFSNFSPSATLQFKASERLNLYARYAQGFKSGIFSSGSSSLASAAPEKIKQYELGLKSDLLPWLRVNGAAYYSDYTNLQGLSRDPVTGANVLQNAASAEIKGGELEITASPTANFNLRAGLAIQDGKYKKFEGAQVTYPVTTADPPAATPCQPGTGTPIGGNRTPFCDVSGNPIQKIPKWQIVLGADYTVDVGASKVTLSGNMQYQSKFNWDPSGRLVERARALLDARLTWALPGDRFSVSLWGQNLTDRVYFTQQAASGTEDGGVYGRPRTVGFELAYKY